MYGQQNIKLIAQYVLFTAPICLTTDYGHSVGATKFLDVYRI